MKDHLLESPLNLNSEVFLGKGKLFCAISQGFLWTGKVDLVPDEFIADETSAVICKRRFQ
jgi:hypothetical protein